MLKKSFLIGLLLASAALPAAALSLGDLKTKLGDALQPAPQPAAAPDAATTNAASPATSTATSPSPASRLSSISKQDQVTSLRQALTQAAETAVSSLAKENGFLGNDKVRIPLPENLQKADNLLRKFGMGNYADDLTTSMNRAAEAAVPEAKTLLVGAVKKMSVADARDIIIGPSDAATQYFRKNTETEIASKFQPIIAKSMAKVKLAESYDRFAGKGAELGLVDAKDANLKDYITRKAMDGLFLTMAEQEKAIRANPLQATGDLAKKVFSVLLGK